MDEYSMNASQSLRRPSNWQDFETLCKKLWGEIWHCPEIKKNGRAGQVQHGVDVSGIPSGEQEYYGIQCKGKDEYTLKQFTDKEIDTEIVKAKLFRPALKKLYFATTAIKDAAIEEYVRIKNKEHIANGLFEVHLFSWEDIVDLIDENQETHDWYLNSNSFKQQHSVLVTFQDDSQSLTIHPKFRQGVEYFINQATHDALRIKIPGSEAVVSNIFKMQQALKPFIIARTTHSISLKTVNYSFAPFQFKILNTGTASIEEFKFIFEINTNKGTLSNTNIIKDNYLAGILPINGRQPSLVIDKSQISGKISPSQNILVSEDNYVSSKVYIKPLPEKYSIDISWKLISKYFKDQGSLNLIIEPNVEKNYKETIVEDRLKRKSISGTIEEFIVEE